MTPNPQPDRVLSYIAIGAFFVLFGLYLCLIGVDAAISGEIIEGRRGADMTGWESIALGLVTVVLGAFGIRWGWTGRR